MGSREYENVWMRELYKTNYSVSESNLNMLISSYKNSGKETIAFYIKCNLNYISKMITSAVFGTYAHYDISFYNFEICDQIYLLVLHRPHCLK